MLSDIFLPAEDGGYLSYSAVNGMFFVYVPATKLCDCFKVCRTEFAWKWEGLDPDYQTGGYPRIKPYGDKVSEYIGFVLYPTGIDIPVFAAKWDDMEIRLGLIEKTIIYRTSASNKAMIFKLSPFWLANDTVRSFVTLFIRMLAVYPRATFDESVRAYHLSARIIKAIEWFMAGNTHPTYQHLSRMANGDNYLGVINEFQLLSPDEIAAKLTKPPVKA